MIAIKKNRQEIFQSILKKNRLEFIIEATNMLPMRYRENRYKKTQWRNKYEVHRIIDKRIDKMMELAKNKKEFVNLLLYILPERYKSFVAKKGDIVTSAKLLEHYHYFLQTKQELDEEYENNLLKRENEFLLLYFDMVDKIENSENRSDE